MTLKIRDEFVMELFVCIMNVSFQEIKNYFCSENCVRLSIHHQSSGKFLQEFHSNTEKLNLCQ